MRLAAAKRTKDNEKKGGSSWISHLPRCPCNTYRTSVRVSQCQYIHIYINLTLATARNPILNQWSILHYNTCPIWYWLFMAVLMPDLPLCKEGRICVCIRILGLFIDFCIQPPTVETVCSWPSYPKLGADCNWTRWWYYSSKIKREWIGRWENMPRRRIQWTGIRIKELLTYEFIGR